MLHNKLLRVIQAHLVGFSTNIVLSCKCFCLFCLFRTSLSFAGCLVQLVSTYFPNRVINRHLRHGRFWSVNFIIGSGHGEPAPTLPAPVWLLPYKHFIRLGGSNACNQGGEG